MASPKGHAPYPGCETGGRPEKWTIEVIDKEADELMKWLEVPGNFWFEEFCIQRKYCPEYMIDFARKSDKFRQAYEFAKGWQKSKLVRGSLTKKMASNTVHLLLSHSYGIHLKSESVVTGSTDNPLSLVLNAIENESKDMIDGKA